MLHLSKSASHFDKVKVFRWDPERRIISPGIFEDIDYIVHLAEANIGEKMWIKKKKFADISVFVSPVLK